MTEEQSEYQSRPEHSQPARGLAQRDLDLPGPEARILIGAHAEANAVNKARDDGFRADYWTPRQASKAGHLTARQVRRSWWDQAAMEPSAQYGHLDDDMVVYFRDTGERYVRRLSVQRQEGSRHAFEICIHRCAPSEHPHEIHEGPDGWTDRMSLFQSHDVSVHTGPHGIQWGARFHRREVFEAFFCALRLARGGK